MSSYKGIIAALFLLLVAVLGTNIYVTQERANEPMRTSKEKADKEIKKEEKKKQETVAVTKPEPKQTILNVPVLTQLPELPRGCEVTSLAMLLQYAGVPVDKMELAKRIKRDPAPYEKRNGKVFFGHPNEGFVGDMYSFNNPGLGVYHKPIKELAEDYLPGRIVDMTGSAFSEIENSISNGIPVWIITNSQYKKLPAEEFETWQTPSGEVEITYREHSVVVTGFNKNYVYFNDPLTGEKNRRAKKQEFIDAWVQMGRQTIAYL